MENPVDSRQASKAAPRAHWLLISHAFNMDGRAASLTVTDRVASFQAAGVELHVVSAITGDRSTACEHIQVLPAGPAALRFDLRHRLRRSLGKGLRYRLLTVGISVILSPLIAIERALLGLSSNWSWATPAARAGMRVIRRTPIDVIYSSGGEWSAHEAARVLNRRTGIPWIAEIHDPLVVRESPDDDGRVPRRTREGRRLQRLESDICRDATMVWWFTEAALGWARRRHPELGTRGLVVCPGAPAPTNRWPHRYRDRMHIGHFGMLAATRSLEGVLEGLRLLLDQEPDAPVCLHVYGADPPAADVRRIEQLALSAHVILHGRLERDPATGRSGRDRVHEAMQTSDALLLLHGHHEGCTEYIPSKLYEYLQAARPVLGVTHRNPELDALVRRHGGLVVPDGDAPALAAGLRELLRRWVSHDLSASGVPAPNSQDATREILRATSVHLRTGTGPSRTNSPL